MRSAYINTEDTKRRRHQRGSRGNICPHETLVQRLREFRAREEDGRTTVEFRSFKMSLFLILMLPLAVTHVSTITVRVGDDVTLPCDKIKDLNDECNSTTWLFSGSRNTSTLFEYGKILKDVGSKSNRLSVTSNCLLVIKNVTDEDDGRYTCRQFDKSGRQVTDSGVDLSVNNETTTTISTTTKKKAAATTKTVATSSKTQSPPPPITTKMATTHNNTPDQPSTTVTDESGSNTTTVTVTVVAVILAAFIITVVAVVRWKKTKGNRTQTNENTELNVKPEGIRPAPETSRLDTADAADDVYYSSISYIKDTNSKARDKSNEGDLGAYSTVKAPSTSVAASTDSNCLYSTIT
ncbi:uncharacterized protein LOC124998624 [Mugil cephalus]|uniref:uncharacterized protein LOC124998624 n=1 Tax=Mugil cephalus TaxID=48193 RepID=UPI001FB70EA8|nr:uncharacterized protein LOC124998624 [Mugil cephalus]